MHHMHVHLQGQTPVTRLQLKAHIYWGGSRFSQVHHMSSTGCPACVPSAPQTRSPCRSLVSPCTSQLPRHRLIGSRGGSSQGVWREARLQDVHVARVKYRRRRERWRVLGVLGFQALGVRGGADKGIATPGGCPRGRGGTGRRRRRCRRCARRGARGRRRRTLWFLGYRVLGSRGWGWKQTRGLARGAPAGCPRGPGGTGRRRRRCRRCARRGARGRRWRTARCAGWSA